MDESAIGYEFTRRVVKELLKTKKGKQLLFKIMDNMIDEYVETNAEKLRDYLLYGNKLNI